MGEVSTLSVLIPARNERWLARTVADVCANMRGDTDVWVVLDGAWPEPGYELPQHPKVNVVYLPQSIGQRAATNLAAKLTDARYVMKLDGHCALAEGFDVALMDAAKELGEDVTQIPSQRNLHIYDRVCPCGKREYQGPLTAPCVACGKTEWAMDIVWNADRRRTDYWRFDSDLHFQYWNEYKHRPSASADFVDVMTSLGACFFMSRERFWQLGGLDETHGSWGQFGVEIGLKSWLSGGRQVVNKRTWFSHFFRVGGIGFPYEIHGADQERARQYSRDLWRGNKWAGQVRSLRWVLEKFWPVPGWTEEHRDALPRTLGTPSAGILYYSDCRPDPDLLEACRQNLLRSANGLPIVSVTLQPVSLGHNIVLKAERGPLTMFRQILAGLEALDTEYVFFAEHDLWYAPSHFGFVPPSAAVYYYNLNWIKVDVETGRAVSYTAKQLSQLCANRQLLIEHYRTRIAITERDGFSRAQGFEPGSHRRKERIDDVPSDVWRSEKPNLDLRHRHNLTPSRWDRSQFRDQKNCQDWRELTIALPEELRAYQAVA